MQFWAKKLSNLKEKWGKIFEIFGDKTRLGGTGSGQKAGTVVSWGMGKIFTSGGPLGKKTWCWRPASPPSTYIIVLWRARIYITTKFETLIHVHLGSKKLHLRSAHFACFMLRKVTSFWLFDSYNSDLTLTPKNLTKTLSKTWCMWCCAIALPYL